MGLAQGRQRAKEFLLAGSMTQPGSGSNDFTCCSRSLPTCRSLEKQQQVLVLPTGMSAFTKELCLCSESFSLSWIRSCKHRKKQAQPRYMPWHNMTEKWILVKSMHVTTLFSAHKLLGSFNMVASASESNGQSKPPAFREHLKTLAAPAEKQRSPSWAGEG